MRLLLLIAAVMAAFFIPAAHAETVISFERPVTRMDGQPLPLDEISHYDIWCGDPALTPADNVAGAYEIPATGETQEHTLRYQDVLDDYGEFHCALRTVDTDGLQSGWSEPSGTDVWEPARPSAPTSVVIIIGAAG